jgi:hypothetical protein
MRFNRFLKADGEAFGSMVCTICNKNIVLEQEPMPAENAYGEGSRLLTVVGTPKPPKEDRRRATDDSTRTGSEDQTL